MITRVATGIVLLDAEMTGVDVLESVQAFRLQVPRSALLVITLEPDRLISALHADGAIAAVGKVGGSEALLAALQRLAKATD